MILICDNLKFRPRALCEQQQSNANVFLILTAIIHSEIIVDLNLCPSKYRCNYLRNYVVLTRREEHINKSNFKPFWSKQIKRKNTNTDLQYINRKDCILQLYTV